MMNFESVKNSIINMIDIMQRLFSRMPPVAALVIAVFCAGSVLAQWTGKIPADSIGETMQYWLLAISGFAFVSSVRGIRKFFHGIAENCKLTLVKKSKKK